MKSFTKTNLEEYPSLLAVILEMWDTAAVHRKWTTWFMLHGAAIAIHEVDPPLAAELVFLRELWAEIFGFGA